MNLLLSGEQEMASKKWSVGWVCGFYYTKRLAITTPSPSLWCMGKIYISLLHTPFIVTQTITDSNEMTLQMTPSISVNCK